MNAAKATPSLQVAAPNGTQATPTAAVSDTAEQDGATVAAIRPTGGRRTITPDAAAAPPSATPDQAGDPLPAAASHGFAVPTPAAALSTGIAAASPAPVTPAAGQTIATPIVPTTATPTPPAASATPTASATDVGAPARQVAAALVQVSQAPSGSSVTLRLDPAELGHVQVRIDRDADGTSTVHVSVERPDTLRLLMADQPALNRTLDNAGLPQDGRSLSLSLSTPDNGGNASPGTGGGFMGGGSFSDSAGSGQQRAPRQDRNPYPDPAIPTPTAAWLRAGVDITA